MLKTRYFKGKRFIPVVTPSGASLPSIKICQEGKKYNPPVVPATDPLPKIKIYQTIKGGSGGAIADTKTQLQAKTIVGWANSKVSDIRIKGVTATGTVQSGTKKVGSQALSYSGGDNSAISIRLNEVLKAHKIYSISCWCRWNRFNFAGAWGMYAAQLLADNGINTACSNTGVNPSGHIFYALANNQTVLVSAAIAAGTLSINTWYHFIYEVNDTYLKLYLNGTLQSTSATFANTIDFWTSAQIFRLAGYAGNAASAQLDGYLDEFYILDGALSQTEIDWLYNSGNGNTLI